MTRKAAFACLLAFAAPAYAQTDAQVAARLTPALHACENAPEHGGTLPQAICYRDEAARQDRRLNDTWARVVASLPVARKEALRNSERRWIKQRDADCREESDEQDGFVSTTTKYMFNACIADASIRRTLWLEHFR